MMGCINGAVTDLAILESAGYRAGAIYADPPWSFKVYSGLGKARSAENHYLNTMDQAAIEALGEQIQAVAAKDCALFMWAVMPQIPEALKTLEAWGFAYKTMGFTWVKRSPLERSYHLGMGYWTRSNAELCLLATRGKPKRLHKGVEQLVVAPVGKHSSKPSIVHERIERLVAGPYLELFARRKTPGWMVWGNEIGVDLFDEEST